MKTQLNILLEILIILFFWDWVREISKKNVVYVSEYKAPKDFKSVWKKTVNNSLDKNTGSKKGEENLFTLNL